MSVDATISTWKLNKSQVTATEKLFLLSCADRASEDGICWPSVKRISLDTCLDRKTVIDVRQSVINKNLLEYTGEMKGKTKLIPVMRLTYIKHRFDNSTENGTESELNSPENGTPNSPENGTVKQSRKRDTESKRVEPKIGTYNSLYSAREPEQNSTKFDPLSNSSRSVKIDGVEPNHTAKSPQCGSPTMVANGAHTNTTSLQSQDLNKNTRESARETEQNPHTIESGLHEQDSTQSIDHKLCTENQKPVAASDTKTPDNMLQSQGQRETQHTTERENEMIDPNYQYPESLFDNHPYAEAENPAQATEKELTKSSGHHPALSPCYDKNTVMQLYKVSYAEAETFAKLVSMYPRVKNVRKAQAHWFSQRCHEVADSIFACLEQQIKRDKSFLDGYAPALDKYIAEQRWNEPVYAPRSKSKPEYDNTDTSWIHKKDIFDQV